MQIVGTSFTERRFTMLVLIIFAATAVLLAAFGIYGVMSLVATAAPMSSESAPTLGTTRRQIVGLVLRHGLRLAATGMTGGLVAALLLTRFMTRFIYGVHADDPAALATMLLLLGAITLLACYIPARRTTAVDPVTALRCE